MVPLSQFYSRVLPHVTGCPEPLMAQAVLDAADEFCTRSLVVRSRLAPVSVEAGVDTYEITPPSLQRVATVTHVWLDGRQLNPAPQETPTDLVAPLSWPDRYSVRYVEGALSLVLYPAPDRDLVDGLVVEVATRPDRGAAQVDPTLFSDWAEGVAHGALYRLHLTPGQPYSDPSKAEFHGRMAASWAARARTESIHGRSQVGLRVTMREF